MPKSKSKASVRVARPRPQSSRPQHKSYDDDIVRFYSGRSDTFRMPDHTTAPSATMRVAQDVSLTTNANGDALVLLSPVLSTAQGNFAVTAGTLGAAANWTAHPQQASIMSFAKRAKINAWRITVLYIGAEATTQGVMFMGLTNDTSVLNGISMNSIKPQMKAFTMKPGGRYTFYVPLNAFQNPELPQSSSFGTEAWPTVILYFNGLPPSAQPILMRDVRACEYYPEMASSPALHLETEPHDPVGMAEAGSFPGVAAEEAEDSGPSWASKLGAATYDFMLGGAGRMAQREGDRAVLRNHLQARNIGHIEF